MNKKSCDPPKASARRPANPKQSSGAEGKAIDAASYAFSHAPPCIGTENLARTKAGNLKAKRQCRESYAAPRWRRRHDAIRSQRLVIAYAVSPFAAR